MHFSSGFFGSLITRSENWKINLDKHELTIQRGESHARRVGYPSVTSVIVIPGAIWATVKIKSSEQLFELDGITNSNAGILKKALTTQIADNLLQVLKDNGPVIRTLANALEELLNLPKYLAHRDVTQWFARHESSSR